jgi:hypothetical protein
MVAPRPYAIVVEPYVDARVHATGGTPKASGGRLLWYRHLGRADGSSRWDGPHHVGTGWSGFEHVGSAQNGVIYLVEPQVDAKVRVNGKTQRASGGRLRWLRHLGHEDGSFQWFRLHGPARCAGRRSDLLHAGRSRPGRSAHDRMELAGGRRRRRHVETARHCGIQGPAVRSVERGRQRHYDLHDEPGRAPPLRRWRSAST